MIASARSRLAWRAAASAAALAAAVSVGLTVAGPSVAARPITVPPLADVVSLPSFAPLIERVSPAVVSINVVVQRGGADGPELPFDLEQLPPQWREFFEEFNPRAMPREGRSVGSGFFISADGHIVTNNHVVADATEVTVVMDDGTELDATVVGTDPSTDLAVLKVAREAAFPFVEFEEGARPRVGDWVIAVGNPFGLGGTATAGIVSANGREIGNAAYNDFIQIDASINRGNSGGPTFDLQGRVIGVNSQILSPTGGNIGLGFAIPAEVARRVTGALIAEGKVTRGWLGVTIGIVDEDTAGAIGLGEARGALVNEVYPGSPADGAGFQIGDVVLKVDGDDVKDHVDLTRRVGALAAGQDVRFTVFRSGRERTLRVAIAERPSEDTLAAGVVGAAPELADGADDAAEVLGMSFRRPTPAERERLETPTGGLVVEDLERSSEAAEKGVRPGDLVVEANNTPVATTQDLEAAIAAAKASGRPAILLRVKTAQGSRFVALPLSAGGETGSG